MENEFNVTEETIEKATQEEILESEAKNEKNDKAGRGKEILGSFLLLITALIWGFAFVAQSKGMESVGPFTFNGIRSFVGAIALIPVLLYNKNKIFKVYNAKKEDAQPGVLCFVLCC